MPRLKSRTDDRLGSTKHRGWFLLLVLLVTVVALPGAGKEKNDEEVHRLLQSYRNDDPVQVAALAKTLAEKGVAEAQFVRGVLLDIGVGGRMDHAEALILLLQAAEKGYEPARQVLAWKFREGFGLGEADPSAAAKWREQATPIDEEKLAPWLVRAEEGIKPDFNQAFLWLIDHTEDAPGWVFLNLAEVYLAKNWTSPNAEQHLLWLERAAAGGEMEAVEIQAYYYDMGLFYQADAAKALALRKQAAAAGRAGSQFDLARQYEEGRAVTANMQMAVAWYEKAAKQNHLGALRRLIVLRRDGEGGLARDFAEAVRLAEVGHKLGDAFCIRNLADLYHRGEGVRENLAKALELYQEAAALGEINAMGMLGWMFEHGEAGKPDYPKASDWYQRAAKGGHIVAMRQLAGMHEKGLGRPVDLAAAFRWYEKAAQLGDRQAQTQVGTMLIQGIGITQDAPEGVNWLRLASHKRKDGDYFQLTVSWKSFTDIKLVFDALVTVAREENDLWLQDNLVSLWTDNKEVREAMRAEMLKLAEEPDLLNLPGILPEACLVYSEDNRDNPAMQQQAERLFQKLVAADRPQSAFLFARYALAGHRMSKDLKRAARWAKQSIADTAWAGEALLTVIEHEMASVDDADRAGKLSLVQRYAKGGSADALVAVARRALSGVANEKELESLKRYSFLVITWSRRLGEAEFGQRFWRIIDHLPPDESELKLKISRIRAKLPNVTEVQPALIHHVDPYYPKELKENGIIGDVTVEFVIDQQGRPRQFVVLRSSHPEFEQPAVEAMRYWRFAPGLKQGRPVATKAQQTLKFALSSDEPTQETK